jgi:2-polyprenyl-3-methyl-5-hydroxy-6-metoxy-1,4-benzoquinol methylase
MRWINSTRNPNLPEALRRRASQLDRARRKPIDGRVEFLAHLADGRRVLDVGVVNHVAGAVDDPKWLHGHLAKAASYCLGVDILEDDVRLLREKGYNVVACDITSTPEAITDRFDLIICGELIEHLGSPAGLFEAAARLLVPGGKLIMTTPNPYYLGRVLRHLFNAQRESVDHVTLLFPSGVAEFADRAGLELTEYCGVFPKSETLKRRLFRPVRGVICWAMNDEAACETLIYECTRGATCLASKPMHQTARGSSPAE